MNTQVVLDKRFASVFQYTCQIMRKNKIYIIDNNQILLTLKELFHLNHL